MLNLVRLVTSSSTSILEKSELIVRSKLSVEVILALASIPVFIYMVSFFVALLFYSGGYIWYEIEVTLGCLRCLIPDQITCKMLDLAAKMTLVQQSNYEIHCHLDDFSQSSFPTLC